MLPWMREKLFGGRQKLLNILNRRCESETKTDRRTLADMFVSDSNIFSNDFVKLNVISTEGAIWNVDVAPDFTVDKLKTMALGHFYNPLESAKVAANYRLVSVSGRRPLDSENSVFQEGLKSNDELLLVERRKPPPRESLTEESLQGPSEDEIKAATCNLEPKNTIKIHPPRECSADFQSEIRKILISLVEASARILSATPNAEEVFKHIRERLENKRKSQPDSQAVKELMDMGFPEHVAARALLLNSSNQRQALDWLLEHGNEIESIPEDEEISLNGESSDGQASSSKSNQHGNICDYHNNKKSTPTMTQTVAKLLDLFRAYKRQEFKPNPKALENLLEMGFTEEEIVDALRITGNNQASACEWLLGERRPSLEDLDNGLDPDGPIYKAIMANPAIQLSLTSPKMLFAFLSMLENPGSANMWINDPDASPVLSQIFKTYHAEKHALQINRLMEQQQHHQS